MVEFSNAGPIYAGSERPSAQAQTSHPEDAQPVSNLHGGMSSAAVSVLVAPRGALSGCPSLGHRADLKQTFVNLLTGKADGMPVTK